MVTTLRERFNSVSQQLRDMDDDQRNRLNNIYLGRLSRLQAGLVQRLGSISGWSSLVACLEEAQGFARRLEGLVNDPLREQVVDTIEQWARRFHAEVPEQSLAWFRKALEEADHSTLREIVQQVESLDELWPKCEDCGPAVLRVLTGLIESELGQLVTLNSSVENVITWLSAAQAALSARVALAELLLEVRASGAELQGVACAVFGRFLEAAQSMAREADERVDTFRGAITKWHGLAEDIRQAWETQEPWVHAISAISDECAKLGNFIVSLIERDVATWQVGDLSEVPSQSKQLVSDLETLIQNLSVLRPLLCEAESRDLADFVSRLGEQEDLQRLVRDWKQMVCLWRCQIVQSANLGELHGNLTELRDMYQKWRESLGDVHTALSRRARFWVAVGAAQDLPQVATLQKACDAFTTSQVDGSFREFLESYVNIIKIIDDVRSEVRKRLSAGESKLLAQIEELQAHRPGLSTVSLLDLCRPEEELSSEWLTNLFQLARKEIVEVTIVLRGQSYGGC